MSVQSLLSDATPQLKARKRGLGRLHWLRTILLDLRRAWLVYAEGMDIHPTAKMSLSAGFDRSYPKGIHVGAQTLIAFETWVLTYDETQDLVLDTWIGRNCFIGGRSMILPGVKIGDNCVVGAGSVVTQSVPAGSLVAGNPARVLRSGIEVGPYGRFLIADAKEASLVQAGVA